MPHRSSAATIQRLFTAEHLRFVDLGRQLLSAIQVQANDEVTALWWTLETALLAHLHAEEDFMIPALGRAKPREARAILAEHRAIRDHAQEISGHVRAGTIATRSMRRLVDELDAHARHEERVFYAWADEWLDEEEKRLLFDYRDSTSKASSALSSSSTFTGLVK